MLNRYEEIILYMIIIINVKKIEEIYRVIKRKVNIVIQKKLNEKKIFYFQLGLFRVNMVCCNWYFLDELQRYFYKR